MPVFLEKEQHTLIQLESDDDWESLYGICEGYITHRDAEQIQNYLNSTAKTVVLEKGYVDTDYRDTYFNFFPEICAVSGQNYKGKFFHP